MEQILLNQQNYNLIKDIILHHIPNNKFGTNLQHLIKSKCLFYYNKYEINDPTDIKEINKFIIHDIINLSNKNTQSNNNQSNNNQSNNNQSNTFDKLYSKSNINIINTSQINNQLESSSVSNESYDESSLEVSNESSNEPSIETSNIQLNTISNELNNVICLNSYNRDHKTSRFKYNIYLTEDQETIRVPIYENNPTVPNTNGKVINNLYKENEPLGEIIDYEEKLLDNKYILDLSNDISKIKLDQIIINKSDFISPTIILKIYKNNMYKNLENSVNDFETKILFKLDKEIQNYIIYIPINNNIISYNNILKNLTFEIKMNMYNKGNNLYTNDITNNNLYTNDITNNITKIHNNQDNLIIYLENTNNFKLNDIIEIKNFTEDKYNICNLYTVLNISDNEHIILKKNNVISDNHTDKKYTQEMLESYYIINTSLQLNIIFKY